MSKSGGQVGGRYCVCSCSSQRGAETLVDGVSVLCRESVEQGEC